MIKRIQEEYKKDPNYKRVAKKLRLDWKSVKKYANPSKVREGMQLQEMSTEAQKRSTAFRMLKEGRNHIDIAIALGAASQEIESLSKEYCRLEELDELGRAYQTLGNDFSFFLELYGRMQSEKMNPADFIVSVRDANYLREARIQLSGLKNEIAQAKASKQEIENQTKLLQDSLTRLQGKIAELQTRSNLLQSRVESLKAISKELRSNKNILDLDLILGDIETYLEDESFLIALASAGVLKGLMDDDSMKILFENSSSSQNLDFTTISTKFKELKRYVRNEFKNSLLQLGIQTPRKNEGGAIMGETPDVDAFVIQKYFFRTNSKQP